MDSDYIKTLQKKADELRMATLNLCVMADKGHVTSAFSCAEILTVLYYGNILRYDVNNPKWEDRDRFLISKGHASPIFYSLLADVGFIPSSHLEGFCKGQNLGVHLQSDVPGVENTAGSLGHGLGIAAGMALAAKMDRKTYYTIALLGDGECCEGSVWESAMFAGQQNLNNLIVFVDRNYMMATDFTENAVGLAPLDKKLEAFGWDTLTIDGHSIAEIHSSLEGMRSFRRKKPLAIIAQTVKGKGVPSAENKPAWHARAPKGDTAEAWRQNLATKGEMYNG
jgi:transketolase